MKRLFKIPEDFPFSGKYILLFMLPIIFEQFLVSSLSIADTFMVSMLPDSSTALAGIANVSRIDLLFKQIFVALAAGGGIFIAQYLGAKQREDANRALKHGVYSMFAIATILAIIMEIFKVPLLNLLFGKVEEQVMQQSVTYYSITILSYPFMALFNAGTASFRSMGKSKATFIASIAMMAINLILKYIFLFPLNMGILGAGLSLLIAYAVVGVALFIMLLSPKNPAHIDKPFDLKMNFNLLGRMYGVALPTGIENGLFQLGALILQTLVATLGTAAINANHLTNNLRLVTTCCNPNLENAFLIVKLFCSTYGVVVCEEGVHECRKLMMNVLEKSCVGCRTVVIILCGNNYHIIQSKRLVSCCKNPCTKCTYVGLEVSKICSYLILVITHYVKEVCNLIKGYRLVTFFTNKLFKFL